jgi:pyruvyltransferase
MEKIKNKEILIINLKNNYEDINNTLDKINSCELIFSSLLHGLIISHSYNIPCILFEINNIKNDYFKFIDYYKSVCSFLTNMPNNDIIEIIKKKINIFDLDLNKFDEYLQKCIKPDLIENRISDLIDTCPFIEKNISKLLNF